MLSPDHQTRMALVADRHAELRRRAESAEARRAANRPRLFASRRLRLHGVAHIRRAAPAA